MDRKANLTVEKVKKDSHDNIVEVSASIRLDKLSKGSVILTKEDIIFLIEDGDIVYTRLKNSKDNFELGSQINVITLNGKKYLRTDRNNIKSDNLDNLPTFN